MPVAWAHALILKAHGHSSCPFLPLACQFVFS